MISVRTTYYITWILGILTTGFGALQGAVFSTAMLHMYIVNLRG